jgi:selenocysteine lyase/cysteine desulfurase
LLEGLLKTKGVHVYGISDEKNMEQRVPTFSFTVKGRTPREISAELDRKNIFVWDGHFYAVEAIRRLGLMDEGGVVRVGLYHYNIMEEVETLLEAISKMGKN